MAKRYTNQQRMRLVGKVQRLMKQGVKVNDACVKVGISNPSFYTWRNWMSRRRTNGPRPTPHHEEHGSAATPIADAVKALLAAKKDPALENRLEALEHEWAAFKVALGVTDSDLGK